MRSWSSGVGSVNNWSCAERLKIPPLAVRLPRRFRAISGQRQRQIDHQRRGQGQRRRQPLPLQQQVADADQRQQLDPDRQPQHHPAGPGFAPADSPQAGDHQPDHQHVECADAKMIEEQRHHDQGCAENRSAGLRAVVIPQQIAAHRGQQEQPTRGHQPNPGHGRPPQGQPRQRREGDIHRRQIVEELRLGCAAPCSQR